MSAESSRADTMKHLLMTSGVFEAATGVAMILTPATPVRLLVGVALDTAGGLIVARVAGAALLALGLGCWRARHDDGGHAARGLVGAMLLYNLAASGVLLHANLAMKLSAVGLWPTVLLHLGLAGWCVACLRTRGQPDESAGASTS